MEFRKSESEVVPLGVVTITGWRKYCCCLFVLFCFLLLLFVCFSSKHLKNMNFILLARKDVLQMFQHYNNITGSAKVYTPEVTYTKYFTHLTH